HAQEGLRRAQARREEAPTRTLRQVRHLGGVEALLRREGSEGRSREPGEDADPERAHQGRPDRARGPDAAASGPRGLIMWGRKSRFAKDTADSSPIIRLSQVHKVYDSGENAV